MRHAPNKPAWIMPPELYIRVFFLRLASEQKQNAKCDMGHYRPKQKPKPKPKPKVDCGLR
jgi:hypothetical protein